MKCALCGVIMFSMSVALTAGLFTTRSVQSVDLISTKREVVFSAANFINLRLTSYFSWLSAV